MDRIFLLFISFLFLVGLQAQEGEIVPLSRKVGLNVNSEENKFYSIFPGIQGFASAQFYRKDDDDYHIRIVYNWFGKSRIKNSKLSLMEFVELQNRINGMPEFKLIDTDLTYYQSIQNRTREILKNIPDRRLIKITLRDNTVIEGDVRDLNKNDLKLKMDESIIKNVKLRDIKAIYHLGENKTMDRIYKYRFIISSILSLGAVESWNQYKNPRTDLVWWNRSIAIGIGFLSVNKIYEYFDQLFSPKIKFNLTQDELSFLKKYQVNGS